MTVPETSNRRGKRAAAAFPRSMRLLRHADFERVYKSGRRHFSASMTVFFLPRPEAAPPGDRGKENEKAEKKERSSLGTAAVSGLRVGFTVGRALGNAVHRNRMKRRLREAVRMSRPPAGPSADVVINPKKSLLTADFQDVLNEVRRAFVVIEQKLALPLKENAESREPKAGSR
jgi:ribonuclease P protein component